MKRFKTTGLCNPKKQYMVDIKDKLEKVKALIKNEEYFIINRPRQYGKSTLLFALKKELSKRYVVISISFEGIGDESFKNAEFFSEVFIELILKSLNTTNKEEKEKFKSLLQKKICNFVELSKIITEFISSLNKEVVLIIDEVDKSSSNQVFLNFLGMLRNKYLDREAEADVTFKSVILAGVYDVKNLKLKIRPDEEKKYNSPWNIAVPFKVDMSLSQVGIEGMLKEYSEDRDIKFNVKKASEFIYFYTNGYPFLVSRLCQIIDEDLGGIWKEESMIKSVKIILLESNTLFDDLIKNMENNKELYNYIFDLIINGADKSFNIDNPIINLGLTFGYFKNVEGKVKISNRIFEQRLYNYYISKIETEVSMSGYNVKSSFLLGNGLNIEKILTRFQQFMKEQYSSKDIKFLESQGRLLFLSFLAPIVNGTGFVFKEVQISEEKRLDVVITYNNHKYIIELKVWRGEEYHEKGLKQLADYLDINNQNKGYLLVFNFNKNKEYKKEELTVEGKEIFEVFV